MNRIIKILMNRDGISYKEAEQMYYYAGKSQINPKMYKKIRKNMERFPEFFRY